MDQCVKYSALLISEHSQTSHGHFNSSQTTLVFGFLFAVHQHEYHRKLSGSSLTPVGGKRLRMCWVMAIFCRAI